MSEQEFFDLGIQVIAGRATPEEKAALDAELARRPELKAELDRLRAVSAIAGEVVQLTQVMEEASPAELPGYARRRLQEGLKKTFPVPASAPTLWERLQDLMNRWRWALGTTATASVIALFVVISHLNSHPKPVFQLAMMDAPDILRGGGNGLFSDSGDVSKEVKRQMQNAWPGVGLKSVKPTDGWLDQWPTKDAPVVKIIYRADLDELLVVIRRVGSSDVKKTFHVTLDQPLPVVIKQAQEFVHTQLK